MESHELKKNGFIKPHYTFIHYKSENFLPCYGYTNKDKRKRGHE